MVRAVKEDAYALVRKRAHHAIEFLLGADIDAAHRIVEEDDARLDHQPFGKHNLLLIAARKTSDRTLEGGRRDGEVADRLRPVPEPGFHALERVEECDRIADDLGTDDP